MQEHDMGAMSGMDHSAMGNMESMSGMEGMESMQPAAPTESRTPVPVLTDADRRAAFPDVHGHKVHDSNVNWYLLADQLEWQKNNEAGGFSWDVSGWAGGDIDRLWLRSEGETSDGKTESAEVQALWGHAVSPWWDVVAGARQDFKPGWPQTWAAAGFQGMPLYNLETELTAFAGEQGRTALRFEAEYDVLLTNRLILQPSFEANFYGKDDEVRETGKGLSGTELSLRLRYEMKREFAPYVGVSWSQLYGNTADMATREGEKDNELRFLLGARVWF
ncbi:copper resistance protein B [Pantoea sp. ARC270]|uniref:copper resistance protein B n=1 Tax=Pantoea sp. ARC270 TaxID=2027923 RepID=UPI0035143688